MSTPVISASASPDSIESACNLKAKVALAFPSSILTDAPLPVFIDKRLDVPFCTIDTLLSSVV